MHDCSTCHAVKETRTRRDGGGEICEDCGMAEYDSLVAGKMDDQAETCGPVSGEKVTPPSHKFYCTTERNVSLHGNPTWEAIWSVIKRWDINTPRYAGYCGGTGDHATEIYDAITNAQVTAPSAASADRTLEDNSSLRLQVKTLTEALGKTLFWLEGLAPDFRCRAIEDAVRVHNEMAELKVNLDNGAPWEPKALSPSMEGKK